MKKLISVAIIGLVCLCSSLGLRAALPAEQVYFTTFNPSLFRAVHFDGTTFITDDINPGSAATSIAASLEARSLALTDRFYFSANGFQGLTAVVVDRATGVELPRATTTIQFSREAAVSADGQFGYVLGNNPAGALALSVIDLRPASPTFDTEIGVVEVDSEFIGDVGATNGMAVHPQGGAVFVKVRHLSPDTIRLKTIDVSNPVAPAVAFDILATDPSPGAPNFEVPGGRMRTFVSQGEPYLFAVRRSAQVYHINADGSLTYVQSLSSVNTTPGVNSLRTIRDIKFVSNAFGDRAFAVTIIANAAARPLEAIGIDMTRTGGTFAATVLGAATIDSVIAGQEGAGEIAVSSDISTAFVLRPNSGRLVALSTTGILSSSPSAVLSTFSIGNTGNTGTGLAVDAPIVPSPAGPTIGSVAVDGAPDGVLINDQVRTLTITGTNLDTVTHASVGLTRVSISSASAGTLTLSVPALIPANKSPVLLIGPDGSASAPVTIANTPTYLPSFVLHASSGNTNEIAVLNAATKTEVLTAFPTGEGPVDSVSTADGRLLLVADFRGIAKTVTVHSLVNDASLGFTRHQILGHVNVPGNTQRVVINPVRPRAYVFAGSNLVGVIDTDPLSPTFLTTLSTLALPPVTTANGGGNANARGLAIAPDGRHLFIGRGENPFIVVINVESDLLTPAAMTPVTFADGPANPSRTDGLTLSPDGTRLYFMTQFETSMRVFDISTPTTPVQLSSVPVPGSISGDVRRIQAMPDGRFVYISGRDRGAVDVFDPALNAIVTTVVTAPRSGEPAVSPQSDFVFVAVGATDAVLTIDERATIGGAPNPTFHTVIAATGAGTGVGAVSVYPGVATDAGSNVAIEPLPDVTIEFSTVTEAGSTTVTSGNTSALTLPPHFAINGIPVFFDVKTTSTFTGVVTVCLPYDPTGLSLNDQANLRLLHEEGGVLVDRTVSVDAVNHRVCGEVTSFSELVIAGFVNHAPTAYAGADRTVAAGASCTANVSFNGNGSQDPDGDTLTYSWLGPFGSLTGATPTGTLGLGTHTVSLTVTDPLGLSSAPDETKITVTDQTAPLIGSLSASPSRLWPPNGQMVGVTVTVSATDNCSATTHCRITSITSNEPTVAGDIVVTGDLTVNVRAKRLGTSRDRVYTITVECVDAAGNKSTRSVTVTVPHNQ